MRIQHNIMAMNAYRNLGVNNRSLSKNLEKLSSGYRINRAGDDAAGLAISEKMRAQIAGLEQSTKNAQSGINLVQTAEGALTEVHDMLNRMMTLATQAANGTYTTQDVSKLNAEVSQLNTEIGRIKDSANFNDVKLLDGKLEKTLQIGPEATDTIQVKVDTSISTVAKVSFNDNASAKTAMATIKSNINTISTIRSNLGAIQNRLEHTVNNLGVMKENIQDAESVIRDTDVAEEMMKYTKNNILIQSAQAMLAQANQVPQGVLQLMQ